MRRLLVTTLTLALLVGSVGSAFAAWLADGSGAAMSSSDQIPDATGVNVTRDSGTGISTIAWTPLTFANGEPIGVAVARERTLPAAGSRVGVASCDGETDGSCTDETPEGRWRYHVGGTYQQWRGTIASNSVDVPPNAPTNASRVGMANPATIQWADNSQIETGYRLERSTGAGWGDAAFINLPAGTTSATDSAEIPCGQTYRYRAIATHTTLGDSTVSNVVDAHGPPCAAPRLSVKALTVTGTGNSRTITVTAQDEHGNVVQGVGVTFEVTQVRSSEPITSTVSCGSTTNSSGICTAAFSRSTAGQGAPAADWSLDVTNMTKSGMTYTPDDNGVTLPVTEDW
jgi:hypothetical protein